MKEASRRKERSAARRSTSPGQTSPRREKKRSSDLVEGEKEGEKHRRVGEVEGGLVIGDYDTSTETATVAVPSRWSGEALGAGVMSWRGARDPQRQQSGSGQFRGGMRGGRGGGPRSRFAAGRGSVQEKGSKEEDQGRKRMTSLSEGVAGLSRIR